MLLYFIAVPVASLVAISALTAFAWTQHQLDLIAA